MSDSTLALLVLAGVIALFAWNRFPVGIVALATALTLWATDLLTLNEAMAGFGEPVVIFIATLFVVSEGLEVTGITAWAGGRLIQLAGSGTTRLLVAVMLLCAVVTALISLNGSVAALLQMVVLIAIRTGTSPSRMLMPMAYAGSAGSLLVLTGSPVNIVVSEAADDAGVGAFGFFDFAWVGVPILASTVLVALAIGARVLPERKSPSATRDAGEHAALLSRYYALADGFYRLRVREHSPLLGLHPDEIDLTAYPKTRLIGMQAGLEDPRPVRHVVEADDVLVVSGSSEEISRMAVELVLAVAMTPLRAETPEDLVTRQAGVVELVVPPRSPLVGETVFPGMVREADLVILAIQHYGSDTGQGERELVAGDALLVYGSWSAIDSLVDDHDVLVVDSPDLMRRQVPLGPGATKAAVIVAAMVAMLALDLVPPAVAGLLAAGAMVLTRVVTSQQAYRCVSWETVVLVGGLIPLSTAIQRSGAGERISGAMLDAVGTGHPYLLLVAMFVLTAVLGLVLSNTATVLIMLPIALATAAEGDISVRPMLMLLTVAASAALLTPVQTPGNMMIMVPGGYRFGDYWKLGLPILLVWLGVAMIVIPLVWPL